MAFIQKAEERANVFVKEVDTTANAAAEQMLQAVEMEYDWPVVHTSIVAWKMPHSIPQMALKLGRRQQEKNEKAKNQRKPSKYIKDASVVMKKENEDQEVVTAETTTVSEFDNL